MGRDREREETTSRLLTAIRNADTFQDALSHHAPGQDPTLAQTLYEMMEKKGLAPKDMIALTGMERSYFYHIFNGTKHPGRNMVLRIGFGLKASLAEMNCLLKVAGFSELYSKRRRDTVLIFAVTHEMTMEEANDLLLEAEEEPLFMAEK